MFELSRMFANGDADRSNAARSCEGAKYWEKENDDDGLGGGVGIAYGYDGNCAPIVDTVLFCG